MEKKLSEMSKKEIMSYLNKYDKYKHTREWRRIKIYDEKKIEEYIEED